jgi:hypothetical protein
MDLQKADGAPPRRPADLPVYPINGAPPARLPVPEGDAHHVARPILPVENCVASSTRERSDARDPIPTHRYAEVEANAALVAAEVLAHPACLLLLIWISAASTRVSTSTSSRRSGGEMDDRSRSAIFASAATVPPAMEIRP